MDYRQAIDYLLTFADFERSGRFADRPDVAPVLSLLRRLGDPHLGRRTVHVAGSKGKGSVAAMVESVLRAAGVSTGLYTSPHLHSYCERIRIAGKPVSEAEFAELTAVLRTAVEAERETLRGRELVTFDLLTALGFLVFRRHGVEGQVVEVGLGGRLDSTNVFESKDVAVVTPISLEHTAILGDSVEQIAREKAAIIRPGCTVVLAPQAHAEAVAVAGEVAEREGAALVDVAESYRWRRLAHDVGGQTFRLSGPEGALELCLPLLGAHQLENTATAVACVQALRARGLAVRAEAIAAGLASVSWAGRVEVLRRRPLIIADGAHNRDSARRFRECLKEYFSCDRAFLIVGTSADKDVAGLAEELAPIAERVLATRARNPRAMAPEQVAAAFRDLGVETVIRPEVGEAVEEAMAAAGRGGVLCLVGSLFVAAEGREHLLGVAAQT